jgi:hypothetical protein
MVTVITTVGLPGDLFYNCDLSPGAAVQCLGLGEIIRPRIVVILWELRHSTAGHVLDQ